jgi:hypothetical protein
MEVGGGGERERQRERERDRWTDLDPNIHFKGMLPMT